jgi:type II secretory pathway pseudopilin PulG
MQHHPQHFNKSSARAFTMAELVVGLGLLGLMAAIALPSVVQIKQNDGAVKVQLQTAVQRLSMAYTQYKLDYDPALTIGVAQLAPYLSQSKLVTTAATVNNWSDATSLTCNTATATCYTMGDGTTVATHPSYRFGKGNEVTLTDRCLPFYVDIDSKYINGGATSDLNTRSALFFMMYSGQVLSVGQLKATCKTYNVTADADVSWVPATLAASNLPRWRQ